MTIAAGLLCTDGIVICADTEQTAGDSKFQRAKIFQHGNYLLVTGAGWSDYIAMAFDKLRDNFPTEPETASDARQTVESVMLDIYENHIYKFHSPNDPNTPSMALIVGVRCKNGNLALIKTCETSCHLSAYDAVGSGSNFFEYWAKYFFDQSMTTDHAGYFCMFILREVKSAAFGCGGSTIIYKLPKNPNDVRVSTSLFTDEDILAGFPQTAINVLLECARNPDSDFAIKQFEILTRQLRGWFKSRQDAKIRAETVYTATAVMPRIIGSE